MAMERGKIEDSFGLVLAELAHKWRRLLDQRLRPKGFSQATWRTLFYAHRAKSGILQKDLAIAIGIEGPSLVRLLDVLESEGLIIRRVSSTDRRGKLILLTAAGDRKFQEIQEAADSLREKLLLEIPRDKLALCLEVFAEIEDNAVRLESQNND